MADAKFTVVRKELVQAEATPAVARRLEDGTLFLDFGRAAFGTLIVPLPAGTGRVSIVVHLGEKLGADGLIDRTPPGTVRYRRIEQVLAPGSASCRIVIPPDPRNTGRAAIRMPDTIGEVYPFRYAEIEAAAEIDPGAVRQVCVLYPFDDNAASFVSSDSGLNTVWELCKHSIKATTFCGVYVDGDRERIPYEGDAYINQLGHYGVDQEYALARYTHEYLIQYPTWPTEWQLHSVLMAWDDYLYTGETRSLETFYDDLCAKTLIDLAREDGLISTANPELCTKEFERRLNLHHDRYIVDHGLRDLVDWPPGSFTEGGQGERDGHDMRPVNTVVNAFHYRALVLMARMAGVLGRAEDRQRFSGQAAKVRETINRLLFDPDRGVYVDGEGASHASLHSNMFLLAFDAVPPERIGSVAAFVKSRGMACSVYGAQHLLDALYRCGEAGHALDLLTATHNRSWHHMIASGGTITWEAWDWSYKNNLDWNHAWGAAPANILMRRLMGVRPLEPGFRQVLIQPQPASLRQAAAKVPTPRGPVHVAFENDPGKSFHLTVMIPRDMTARLGLPCGGGMVAELWVDGVRRDGRLAGQTLWVEGLGPGKHVLKLE